KVKATWDMIDFNNGVVAIAVDELIELRNNMQSQENIEALNKVIQRLETHVEFVDGLTRENMNPQCPSVRGKNQFIPLNISMIVLGNVMNVTLNGVCNVTHLMKNSGRRVPD